ncbi:MAG: 2-C-methyl-D-erythritol 2,4-cyclodiphosphate synthase [candidate division FCPU426 bacterium]
MIVRTGLGQDSHRFEAKPGKPLLLAGVLFNGETGLEGNSDADLVYHALANAVSGVTGHNVIGAVSDAMCAAGVKDSAEYVRAALKSLGKLKICHVSVSVEGRHPKMAPQIGAMRENIGRLLGLDVHSVAFTSTTGEDLTSFGRGEGLQALVLVTAVEA